MIRTPLLLVALLCATAVEAKNLSDLYPRQTLEEWSPRYQRSVSIVLDTYVWPYVTDTEKARLGGTPPPLEFPLWAEEARQRGSPLAYYVPYERGSIVLPVLSLKFLDDICTAWSWLTLNGYSAETISEYAAILRYAAKPPGGFPPPLQALGIPANASDNPKVDDMAQECLGTGIAFILLHEMGHLLTGPGEATPAPTMQREVQADRYAMEIMRRGGLSPAGPLVYFMVEAHWSGLSSAEADHPMSGARVQALAEAVDSRPGAEVVREQMREVGRRMDDPGWRSLIRNIGSAGDLALLRPRRPGEEMPAPPAEDGSTDEASAFSGVYRGRFVQRVDYTALSLVLRLIRDGQNVRGRFAFGTGLGHLVGMVEGNQMSFEWDWGGLNGHGVLEMDGPDRLHGTLGDGEAYEGAGSWTLQRDTTP